MTTGCHKFSFRRYQFWLNEWESGTGFFSTEKKEEAKVKQPRIILAVLLVLVLSGFGGQAVFAGEYRIGCAFAVTGSASWLGEPQRNTVEMIAEQVNKNGGINGNKLVLYIEDTQGDNTRAVNSIKKLIKNYKVSAIIGPSRSGTAMAVIPIVQKEEVPLISCASAEVITNPVADRKWVFKTAQNDSDAIRNIYEYFNKKNIKKAGIITGTTGFGAAGRELMKSMAPEYGIEIAADETYNPSDTDMTAQLISIKNSGAQAVINWSIVPAQSIVPQNMKQLKLDIPLFQSHGFGNIKYVEAAGEAAEGIIFPGSRMLAVDSVAENHPQKKALMGYRADYEAKYKENVSTFGSHAFDAMHIIINALEKVGDDRAKLRDYIETAKFDGTSGVFNYSPENHSGLDKTAFEMLTVKDGKFIVLEQ